MADSKKVLIVEDEAPLRSALASKLEHEGFEVIQTTNGEEALASLEEQTPDIILLDIIMPRMDGFTALEKIRADESKKNIPILVLSNLGQDEDIERSKELGANGFLIKANWKLVDVIKKINETLGNE